MSIIRRIVFSSLTSVVTATLLCAVPSPAAGASERGADWPQFRFDPQGNAANRFEQVLSPATVGSLRGVWRSSIGTHRHYGQFVSSPAVVGDSIYVGSAGGQLYAFDRDTGAVRWSEPAGWVESSPAVAGGRVFVGSDDGHVYAFDAATGGLDWSVPFQALVRSSPTVVRGTVFVMSFDGKLYALDASTGATRWATAIATPDTTPTEASPAVSKGIVYAIGDGGVTALAANSGSILWTGPCGTPDHNSPTVHHGLVVMASFYSEVCAFDAGTGRPRWTAHLDTYFQSSPTLAKKRVILTDFSGDVVALDARNGQVAWTIPTGISLSTTPVVANGVVYVAEPTRITARAFTDGRLLWHQPERGAFSTPAVVGGTVYVASEDQMMMAFGLPASAPGRHRFTP
jgi:outer membrane protein assembly factor BamB